MSFVSVRCAVSSREFSRRSADLQSAVSPICNRQIVQLLERAGVFKASAECNSAIQQIANLRYEARKLPAWGFDRPPACVRSLERVWGPGRVKVGIHTAKIPAGIAGDDEDQTGTASRIGRRRTAGS